MVKMKACGSRGSGFKPWSSSQFLKFLQKFDLILIRPLFNVVHYLNNELSQNWVMLIDSFNSSPPSLTCNIWLVQGFWWCLTCAGYGGDLINGWRCWNAWITGLVVLTEGGWAGGADLAGGDGCRWLDRWCWLKLTGQVVMVEGGRTGGVGWSWLGRLWWLKVVEGGWVGGADLTGGVGWSWLGRWWWLKVVG